MGFKENCSRCGLRSLLFTTNGFLLAVGLVFVGVGGWVLGISIGDNFDFAGADAPAGIIVLGGILAGVAILGCISTRRTSKIMLAIYFGLLLFLCACTICLSAMMFFFGKSLEDPEYVEWKSTDENVVGAIENTFHCCGFNTTAVQRHTPACQLYPKVTCEAAVSSWLSKSFLVVAILVLAFVAVQIISLVATCMYWRHLSKREDQAEEKGNKKEKKKLIQKGFGDL